MYVHVELCVCVCVCVCGRVVHYSMHCGLAVYYVQLYIVTVTCSGVPQGFVVT